MPPPALQSQVQGHSGSQAAQARACSTACTSPRSASRPLAKPGTAASSWTVAFTKQWFWWPGLMNPGGGRRGAAKSPGWCGAAGAAASRQSARRDLCVAQAPCGCAASAGGPGRPASRGACAAGAGLRGGEAGCRTRRAASLTASLAACAAPVGRLFTQRDRARRVAGRPYERAWRPSRCSAAPATRALCSWHHGAWRAVRRPLTQPRVGTMRAGRRVGRFTAGSLRET